MSRREIELMAALAEGTLEDESEARALLEKSAKLRAEYENHLQALEALRSLPEASMTSTEKAALQRDVWTAFTTAPATTTRASGSRRWAIGYAAALLFVGVGVVGALNTMGDRTVSEFGGPSLSNDSAGASTTSAAASGPPSGDSIDRASETRLATVASRLRSGDNAVLVRNEQTEASLDWDACLDRAGLNDFIALGSVEESDALYLVAVPSTRDLEPDTLVSFVSETTCEVVYTDD